MQKGDTSMTREEREILNNEILDGLIELGLIVIIPEPEKRDNS